MIPKHIGIILCLVLIFVSFAGCIDQSTDSPAAPVAQPTITSHPSTVARTVVPTTLQEPVTTKTPLPITPAAVSSKTTFSFQPDSQIRADDFFRMFLSQVISNRSGWLEYRHTHSEEANNASSANSGGAITTDSTYTYEQKLKSANEPDTFQGKPAMHYVETMTKTSDNCPASSYCPASDYVWDVYYDKDTGMVLGGVGYEVGGAGSRWNFPPGQPLAEIDGFYLYDKGYLIPNMIMGSSLEFPGSNEKITFVGNETVTVPAGTFPLASHFTAQKVKCYSICTTVTQNFWAVPGIPGFVKIQYDMDGPHEMYPLIHVHLTDDTELTGWG